MDEKRRLKKIPLTFYRDSDVLHLAKSLIGEVLCTRLNHTITAGIITETEAYAGVNDKASHAYGGRLTARTATMYEAGGTAYVYLCYGIHHLFNVVTNKKGIPDAVLIRAIYPVAGIDTMLRRSGKNSLKKNDSYGPGKISKMLGITTKLDGALLDGHQVWISPTPIDKKNLNIKAGKRIGIDYAGADAQLPYRFTLQNCSALDGFVF